MLFNLVCSCFVSFKVNLQHGTGSDADIPLHMDYRYDEAVVVLNSRENGDFAHEQKYPIFLLPADSFFSLLLTVSWEGFKVCDPGGHAGNAHSSARQISLHVLSFTSEIKGRFHFFGRLEF